MRRVCALLLLLASFAWPAVVKLYMKDGEFHRVREYKVENGRVRFYSLERADWEEIPLELVDLKRTESELRANSERVKQETALADSEEKAERAMRKEIESVPMNPGAYLAEGGKLTAIELAEVKVVNNNRRKVLQVMSPIPIVSGKSTLETDGLHAKVSTSERTPEFYLRLSAEERFGMIKLTPGKTARVVEQITIAPVTKEMIEQQQTVEIFRRQVADMLYKVWPTKPLEPGEYAVVQYTEGKVNVQIWDFTVK